MALFVPCTKSSSFRAWHVDQFLYVRQWFLQDKDADPTIDTLLKSIKGCLPQWSNWEKRWKEKEQDHNKYWESETLLKTLHVLHCYYSLRSKVVCIYA